MKHELSRDEKAAYLANVLCVARAGSNVSGDAALAFESIIERLDADRRDLEAARELLSDGQYRMRLMHEPIVRLANVRDMVLMALSDGNVSDAESSPIEKLARATNFSQADMDMAVKRAETTLRRLKQGPRHDPSRHASADLLEPPPPPPPPRLPPPPPPPPPLPKLAPKPVPRRPAPTPKAVTVENPDTPPPTTAKETPLPRETPEPPPAPDPVAQCRACRGASDHPPEYCFGYGSDELNVWGCRLAKMPWAPGAPWLYHGSFRDDATFVFDKRAIGKEISRALQVSLDCPHLNTDFAECAFEALPARASLWGHWTLQPASPSDAAATDVSVRRFVQGCPVHATVTVSGMRPVGRREALKVIRRALRRCGRTDIDLRLLAQETEVD